MPDNSIPWRCRIRLCNQWSDPIQLPFLIETQKKNRETVRLARWDKYCLGCGRRVLVTYQEVSAEAK